MSNDSEFLSRLNLTPRTHRILALARKEAERLNHNFVGTEHLLLAIARPEAVQEGCLATKVLLNLGLNIDTVRVEVEKEAGSGPDQKVTGVICFTPQTKKVLSLAREEALSLGHSYTGTEHLLLGLLKEGYGLAARVLLNRGVTTVEMARRAVLEELEPKPEEEAPTATAGSPTKEVGVQELGDQFVGDLNKEVSSKSVNDQPARVSHEAWTFLYLELLIVAGYNFKATTLDVLLLLNRSATNLEWLDIVCEIAKRSASRLHDPKSLCRELQERYDLTENGSSEEVRLGCLLQRLTGKLPRKSGPSIDWLQKQGLVLATGMTIESLAPTASSDTVDSSSTTVSSAPSTPPGV